MWEELKGNDWCFFVHVFFNRIINLQRVYHIIWNLWCRQRRELWKENSQLDSWHYILLLIRKKHTRRWKRLMQIIRGRESALRFQTLNTPHNTYSLHFKFIVWRPLAWNNLVPLVKGLTIYHGLKFYTANANGLQLANSSLTASGLRNSTLAWYNSRCAQTEAFTRVFLLIMLSL